MSTDIESRLGIVPGVLRRLPLGRISGVLFQGNGPAGLSRTQLLPLKEGQISADAIADADRRHDPDLRDWASAMMLKAVVGAKDSPDVPPDVTRRVAAMASEHVDFGPNPYLPPDVIERAAGIVADLNPKQPLA